MPKTPKIPIVVKVWAGSEPHDFDYISRSLPSLLVSNLPDGAEILIFDDCSTDPRLRPFLQTLAAQDRRVRVIENEHNKGPNWGQVDAFALVEAEYPDAPYFVNVDDDVVYHRDWLIRIQKAQKELSQFGLNGIFTALNIPLRPAFAELRTTRGRYLLKWKQPALNWVIPRNIYDRIGGFRDDGIAYDTAYQHRLRLHGFGVICLSPSYVQNIGVIGAYARDRFTTASDFQGEGEGSSLLQRFTERVNYSVFRFKWAFQERGLQGIRLVAPIRWGVEMIHEGLTNTHETVAVYWLSDQIKRGWDLEHLVKRTQEVLRVQPSSPFSVRKLHKSLTGKPVAVECNWISAPNLHEYPELKEKYPPLDPRSLFIDILRDVAHFHQKEVIHYKIRRDNIYYDPVKSTWRLAWYGSEFSPGMLPSDKIRQHLTDLTEGLDTHARPRVRERFLCRYLEAIAPEILQGQSPTMSADVFSAAAVVLLTVGKQIESVHDFEKRREAWGRKEFSEIQQYVEIDCDLSRVLSICLDYEPDKRFKSAVEALNALHS